MTLLTQILQPVFILLIAPFTVGLVRFAKARLQNRRGPSPFLPYMQIASLFAKGMTISRYSSWIFAFAPMFVLSVIVIITMGIPAFAPIAFVPSVGNVFVFCALMALASVILVLGGMDTSSTFGHMGSSREMTLVSIIEPSVIVTGATLGGMVLAYNWTDIMRISAEHPYANVAVVLLATLAMLIIALLENSRYPVDNPATHLELTMVHEAMILEYSGPYLAMLEYASAIKITIFALLSAHIIAPFFVDVVSIYTLMLAIFIGIIKVSVVAIAIAILESFVVKMRFYRMQEYALLALLSALCAAVLLIVEFAQMGIKLTI